MPLFRTGIPEALLKFVTLLHKIIQVQDLSKVPQKFGMTSNLLFIEALHVFEQKTPERGTETNANYELFMKDLITHVFLSKALQRQKRYLQRDLYKPRNTTIRDFICRIDKMVDYLDNFPPFGA